MEIDEKKKKRGRQLYRKTDKQIDENTERREKI